MTNQIIRVPRAPLSKPEAGLGIDWRHPFARGLVHSYPFNEGEGIYVKDYARSQDLYRGIQLAANLGAGSILPDWGTFDTVPGLHQGFAATHKILSHAVNSGSTSPDTTGANLLAPIDWTNGLTVHVWMRPVAISANVHFITIGSQATAAAGQTVAVIWAEPFFGVSRPKVTVYSDGASSTTLTGSPMWATVNDYPFEHVITITPNGEVKWYTSNGDDILLGSIATGITPVANSHFWPSIGTGEAGFAGNWDGNIWAVNAWNYVMGPDSAFALMRNPLQMYLSRPGGGYGADVVPPDVNLPVVTLVANPASISAGFPSTLTWTSEFSDTLVIDNGVGSVVVPNGSTIVFPLVTTTYTITATNDFGTAQATATVTVTPRGVGRPPGVSAGAILQRDLTRSSDAGLGPTDNGTPYLSWVTIGSVVLTHPSELAMVLFLTTEALAAGSHPDVSVILDEIAPTTAVPFVSLGAFVPDPPVLVASQTLYSDRFYISQTQQPAVCRHLQVRVDWPAEAFPNELLTWSIVGANVEER